MSEEPEAMMGNEGEEFFDVSSVLAGIYTALVISDVEGMVWYLNPMAESLFGIKNEEAMGKFIGDVVKFRDIDGMGIVTRVLQDRLYRNRAKDLVVHNGEVVVVELEAGLFYRTDGAVQGVVIGLREKEEGIVMDEGRGMDRYERLLDEAKVVPWEMDAESLRMVFIGEQVEEVFGGSVDQWLGSGYWEGRVWKEDYELLQALLEDVAEMGGRRSCECRFTSAQGDLLWVEMVFYLGYKEATEKTAVKGLMFDITDRKAESAQMDYVRRLEMAERLAAGLANDLNNMLGVVEGSVESMEFSIEDNPFIGNYLSQIGTAVARAKTLMRQLQSFSSSASTRVKPVDLKKVMVDVEPLLRLRLPGDVTMEWEVPKEEVWIEADAKQMGQLFINLFLNSVNSVDEDGEVLFKLEIVDISDKLGEKMGVPTRGRHAKLVIQDDGRTIDEETFAHLFEPYAERKRARMYSKRHQGLALPATYGIVNRYSGFIHCEAVEGGGTKFEVYLPMLERKLTEEEREAATGPKSRWVTPEKALVALVADDEILVRNMLKKTLKRNGFEVLEASDGREALAVAHDYNGKVNLIVADVVMPGASAREIYDGIKTESHDVKMVLISGLTEDEAKDELGNVEEFIFVKKPFNEEALMSGIAGVFPELSQKVEGSSIEE